MAQGLAGTVIDGNHISAGAVTAAKIAAGTITANEIAALAITGALIAAGTITADKMNVSTLAAIQAVIGNIKTAASGQRFEVSGSALKFFDSTRERMRLDGDSLYFWDASGNYVGYLLASNYVFRLISQIAANGISLGVYDGYGTDYVTLRNNPSDGTMVELLPVIQSGKESYLGNSTYKWNYINGRGPVLHPSAQQLVQHGSVNVTTDTAGDNSTRYGEAVVSYPTAFSSTPITVANAAGAGAAATLPSCRIASPTATGCTIRLHLLRTTDATVTCYWIAVGAKT